jgi:hypothetical protein
MEQAMTPGCYATATGCSTGHASRPTDEVEAEWLRRFRRVQQPAKPGSTNKEGKLVLVESPHSPTTHLHPQLLD